MTSFYYTFEELPLAIVSGIEAGLVNGQAEIHYDSRGNWKVGTLTLEGFGQRINGVRQWPQVACPAPIAAIIGQRLENDWSGRVEDAISDQIERDREDAAEYRAEMRREHRAVL
jgi:hypothetical protein